MTEELKQQIIECAGRAFRNMFYYSSYYAERIMREGIDSSGVVSSFEYDFSNELNSLQQ